MNLLLPPLTRAGIGENVNASQFYITTGDDLYSLDEKRTLFGEVAEGWEILESINDTPCDDAGRPLQNIRIRHTIILDDPFDDPAALAEHIPEASPPPQFAKDGRLEDDWNPEGETRPVEEIEATNREKEAKSRAVVLEMIGDLPDAEAAPPDNMLFICKLNPVTTEEDLEIIFSRFGTITSCDIIRDWKTGDSLCYAFIGFDSNEACEQAYFKMNNVIIDDRRIKVDFSQSVYHLWKQFSRFGRRGDAGLQREADAHRRGAEELQLKDHLRPMTATQHGGGRYGLVLDEDEGPAGARHGHPRQQLYEHKARGSTQEQDFGGSESHRHRRDKEDRYREKRERREGEESGRRHRSRGLDRDRYQESRSRSRSRDRRLRRDGRYHRR